MADGPYRIEIVESMAAHYHALRRRLRNAGKTDEEITEQFEQIVLDHGRGQAPAGAQPLGATKTLGYQSYGWTIFGKPITYHIRPPDRIVIDNIDP